jgi:hypothetical protein
VVTVVVAMVAEILVQVLEILVALVEQVGLEVMLVQVPVQVQVQAKCPLVKILVSDQQEVSEGQEMVGTAEVSQEGQEEVVGSNQLLAKLCQKDICQRKT